YVGHSRRPAYRRNPRAGSGEARDRRRAPVLARAALQRDRDCDPVVQRGGRRVGAPGRGAGRRWEWGGPPMSARPFRRRNALHAWELHFGPNMTPMVDVV